MQDAWRGVASKLTLSQTANYRIALRLDMRKIREVAALRIQMWLRTIAAVSALKRDVRSTIRAMHVFGHADPCMLYCPFVANGRCRLCNKRNAHHILSERCFIMLSDIIHQHAIPTSAD